MKDILVHLILSLVNFLLNRAHKPEISGSSAKRDKRQKEVPKKNPATERKGEYRTLMN
jgi:hypothetical protein